MSLEAQLIEQCAPTLAGLKVASLFRCCPADVRQFGQEFKALRTSLSAYGLRLISLRGCRTQGAYLLYLYRERELCGVLAQPETQEFLRSMGYSGWAGAGPLLRELSARLHRAPEFPHEIGVFLGYPLADVQGFIANKGKNCSCCGCWKVYGDPEAARCTFARYRRCTQCYRRRFAQGEPVTSLVVAA